MIEKLKSPKVRAWSLGVAAFVVVVCLISYIVEGTREIKLPPVLRITTDAESNEHLEVPIVRYTKRLSSGGAVEVDFVGAIHLGDRSYYQDLNARFKSYDKVLFELVSDGQNLPQQGREPADSLLGTVQRAMCNLVGLDFQLDIINYHAKNFVHADLSPEQLRAAMQNRGESLPELLMRLLKISADPKLQEVIEQQGFKEASLEGINPLLIILRGPTLEERMKLRRFMAQGLLASDTMLQAIEGDVGLSIITDRNSQIMSVLNREVTGGGRSLAIFYGVGHLPDLHTKMIAQGYRIQGVEWLNAWNLSVT